MKLTNSDLTQPIRTRGVAKITSFGPIKQRQFVLRAVGFDGPFPGGNHVIALKPRNNSKVTTFQIDWWSRWRHTSCPKIRHDTAIFAPYNLSTSKELTESSASLKRALPKYLKLSVSEYCDNDNSSLTDFLLQYWRVVVGVDGRVICDGKKVVYIWSGHRFSKGYRLKEFSFTKYPERSVFRPE